MDLRTFLVQFRKIQTDTTPADDIEQYPLLEHRAPLHAEYGQIVIVYMARGYTLRSGGYHPVHSIATDSASGWNLMTPLIQPWKPVLLTRYEKIR
jgi:hypothetical protein